MLQHELKKVAQENPDRHGAWNLGFVERRASGRAVGPGCEGRGCCSSCSSSDRLQGSSLRVLLISHWIAAIPGSIVRCHRGSEGCEAWFGVVWQGLAWLCWVARFRGPKPRKSEPAAARAPPIDPTDSHCSVAPTNVTIERR